MEVTERIGRMEISYRAKTPAEVLALMRVVDAYREQNRKSAQSLSPTRVSSVAPATTATTPT